MANSARIKVRRMYLNILRRRNRVSGVDVANVLGMTEAKYYRIERGEYDFQLSERKMRLTALAELFGLSYDWIVEREQEYIDRKVDYMLSEQYTGRINTLYPDVIRRYRQLNPQAKKYNCVQDLGIRYETVAKYWEYEELEEKSSNEETDNC